MFLVLPSLARAQNGIEDIGTLGGAYVWASGVSADGAVVVGGAYVAGAANWRAFRWTGGGGMVDLGTLGGTYSSAYAVSADGEVVVGFSSMAGNLVNRAFRWTSSAGMVDLGTLGGQHSVASGVSADGAVVVGSSNITGDLATRAFRWTNGSGMVDLGTLGGTHSIATAVSADGSVVVGDANIAGDLAFRAFRWTLGSGMIDLGTLGGTHSVASGVSGDGAVVVGHSQLAGSFVQHAFRWTSGDGMVDLAPAGGGESMAFGVSADGRVVVGSFESGRSHVAFRWMQETGMQALEDWLSSAGVPVLDATYRAHATNRDGSVVVGELQTGRAFIARVSSIGSGLVTLEDVQHSLAGTASGGGMALSSGATVLNGAHSRPLSRRVSAGQRAFWLAGDWGRDDHGTRQGDLGLAEAGIGKNVGPAQINLSLGQTWAKQTLIQNGRARTNGTYLLAEALIPVQGDLWAAVSGYAHHGTAELRRGYLNAGVQDYSIGSPNVRTWGLRMRLEWDQAWRVAGIGLAPYVDISYTAARLAAYTETGGSFPSRFDKRTEKATELRAGAHAAKPLSNGVTLAAIMEAVHRFEKEGARTSGHVAGLFDFSLAGQRNQQGWLRAGVGVEGKLADGQASLMVNATSRGAGPKAWLAANWKKAF